MSNVKRSVPKHRLKHKTQNTFFGMWQVLKSWNRTGRVRPVGFFNLFLRGSYVPGDFMFRAGPAIYQVFWDIIALETHLDLQWRDERKFKALKTLQLSLEQILRFLLPIHFLIWLISQFQAFCYNAARWEQVQVINSRNGCVWDKAMGAGRAHKDGQDASFMWCKVGSFDNPSLFGYKNWEYAWHIGEAEAYQADLSIQKHPSVHNVIFMSRLLIKCISLKDIRAGTGCRKSLSNTD